MASGCAPAELGINSHRLRGCRAGLWRRSGGYCPTPAPELPEDRSPEGDPVDRRGFGRFRSRWLRDAWSYGHRTAWSALGARSGIAQALPTGRARIKLIARKAAVRVQRTIARVAIGCLEDGTETAAAIGIRKLRGSVTQIVFGDHQSSGRGDRLPNCSQQPSQRLQDWIL